MCIICKEEYSGLNELFIEKGCNKLITIPNIKGLKKLTLWLVCMTAVVNLDRNK